MAEIDQPKMLEFIERITLKYKISGVPMWILLAEARKLEGWDAEDVRRCIFFLVKDGKLRIEENYEIYFR